MLFGRFQNHAHGLKARVFVALLLPLLNGCLYVHDDARQKLAREASDSFAKATSVSATKSFITADESHNELVDAVSQKVDQAASVIEINSLLDTTWSDQLAAIQKFAAENTAGLAADAERRQATADKIAESLKELLPAGEAIKGSLEALNAAEREKAKFQASQKLLSVGLSAFVSDDQSTAIEDLRAAIVVKIGYSEYEQTPGSLELHEKSVKRSESIGSLLQFPASLVSAKGDLTSLVERLKDLPGLPGQRLALTLKDPGLSAVLMGLAYDFSWAEEQRLAIEIDEAKRRLKLYDTLLQLRKTVGENLAGQLKVQGGIGLARLQDDLKLPGDQRFRDSILNLSVQSGSNYRAALATTRATDQATALVAATQSRNELQIIVTSIYSSFKSLVVDRASIEALENQVALGAAHAEVRRAAIDLQEREAVIRRGLQGLVGFYDGGVTSDDVKTVIGIAQTIGVFSIAGRVQ